MSMLSEQRYRLKSIADKLSDMNYHDYASEVRDAADTIWQLRNDCVDLRLENEKLRELLHDARNELKRAEDELGRDLMNSATVLLGIRMRKLGIEVDE